MSWALALACVLALGCADEPAPLDETLAQRDGETLWYDGSLLTREGQGWGEGLAAPYDRLPERAQAEVREAVWGLSRHSAGLLLRFESDASELRARWTLTSSSLEMDHMPRTGVSGLDLYVRAESGEWRWLGLGRVRGLRNEARLTHGLPEGRREYLLYLPLYNGVATLAVGVPAGAQLWPAAERPAERSAPVVFYGTSITQGACASRPGTCHVARLGRRLDRPVINLGFSGNGRMEVELAPFLGELNAAVYVLDCLPNLRGEQVRERTPALVRALRARRPETPIVLVEDRTYGDAHLVGSSAAANAANRAALRAAYEELLAEGVQGLSYVEGDTLLELGGDDTVDGSHPNDLGFLRHADALEPVLRAALGDAR